jgi:hypothetical protein
MQDLERRRPPGPDKVLREKPAENHHHDESGEAHEFSLSKGL